MDEGHDAYHFARERLDSARNRIAVIPSAIATWLTGLGVGTTSVPTSPERVNERERREVSKLERERLLKEHRQRLAPGIEGKATHGRWVDADGATHQLKSGRGSRRHRFSVNAFLPTAP